MSPRGRDNRMTDFLVVTLLLAALDAGMTLLWWELGGAKAEGNLLMRALLEQGPNAFLTVKGAVSLAAAGTLWHFNPKHAWARIGTYISLAAYIAVTLSHIITGVMYALGWRWM